MEIFYCHNSTPVNKENIYRSLFQCHSYWYFLKGVVTPKFMLKYLCPKLIILEGGDFRRLSGNVGRLSDLTKEAQVTT